jgi:Ca-activated chloride channel homolog
VVKLSAAVAVLMLSIGGGGPADQVFRTGVDLVHFGVVVTDKQGAPITGLTEADFEIVEGGKPQTITFFAAGDPAIAPPLHLGFLLDTSGSMGEDISDVRTAAIKFLKAVDTAVDVTVVDFDTQVRMARYGASESERLIERIRSRKPDGYTALYDALGMYLHGASDQMGEKILVMYTDGGDTRSSITLSEVVELLKASDVTVYAIGYLEHQSSSGKLEQRMQLQRFASLTGGQAFFPTSVKEVDKMYEKIQREIAARYSLGYTSTDLRTDGAWRSVQVHLKRKDLKGAKLRTRDGYFGLFKPSREGR